MRVLIASAIAFSLCAASPALARNTFHDIPVTDATESSLGQERLLEVPYFMVGQKHTKVARDMGVFRTNKSTNAFGKSDQQACQIAFLSALIALQNRAQTEGADAVVDIKSITRNRDLESATDFRCVAGGFVANVSLSGRMVKLSK